MISWGVSCYHEIGKWGLNGCTMFLCLSLLRTAMEPAGCEAGTETSVRKSQNQSFLLWNCVSWGILSAKKSDWCNHDHLYWVGWNHLVYQEVTKPGSRLHHGIWTTSAFLPVSHSCTFAHLCVVRCGSPSQCTASCLPQSLPVQLPPSHPSYPDKA